MMGLSFEEEPALHTIDYFKNVRLCLILQGLNGLSESPVKVLLTISPVLVGPELHLPEESIDPLGIILLHHDMPTIQR